KSLPSRVKREVMESDHKDPVQEAVREDNDARDMDITFGASNTSSKTPNNNMGSEARVKVEQDNSNRPSEQAMDINT
ncbi:hypothetical protein Dimus_013910, partial [Dionaea muscipula]